MPAMNTLIRTLACVTFLATLPALHGARAALPEGVASAAKAAGIPESAIGLWAGPVSGGSVRYSHNAGSMMNPASVMKLLATHAALEQLGPAWTWKTRAWLTGPLRDGVLEGDLVIAGSGDPDLTWDRLGQWLRDWRSRGLREIRGNILIDASLYAAPPVEAPFDEAQHRAYNARPEAFLVNFGALSLRLVPGAPNSPVAISLLTPAAPLPISNDIRSISGPCIDWRNTVRGSFRPEGRDLALKLEGRLPASCGERQLNLKVDDALRWAGLVIRAQWQELGGSWSGEARAGAAPLAAAPFSTWESPALPEVLRDMNKWSNNVMARQVLLTLGDDGSGALTPQKGIARLQAWMPQRGLDPAQWVLENGSGLSRVERGTPAQFGALLRSAWASPRMPEFVQGLPVIGRDGTMRSRLVDSPLAGRGYVKTGTLDGVKSAAGYLLDAQGNWQAFALIMNHPRAPEAERVVEALLQTLYAQ